MFYFLKKNLVFLVLGISFGIFSFIYRQNIISLVNSPRFKNQTIGLTGLYTLSNMPPIVSQKISQGLTIIGPNDKPVVSSLVKSYDIQNDHQTYIFDIDTQYVWHNGKKLSAYDIDYQINGFQFTPLSNSRLKIDIDKKFSPALSTLSKPLFKNNLIGLGDYRVKKILYREDYISQISLVPLSNDKSKITYKFYPNEKDLITAYKLGEIDQMETTSLPEDIKESNQVKVTKNIQINQKYLALFLNTESEKLKIKSVRQALAYATPKAKDQNERCLSPISPESWAYNPNVKEYVFNPTKAKELIKDYSLDSITLSVSDPSLLPIAQEIKESWKNILKINTEISIDNKIDTDNYEVILAYGAIPSDPDQYLFWHSTQSTNITHLNNPRIDSLLEEGRQTFDSLERKRIYLDFQRFLLEESPAIFLNFPVVYTVTRN